MGETNLRIFRIHESLEFRNRTSAPAVGACRLREKVKAIFTRSIYSVIRPFEEASCFEKRCTERDHAASFPRRLLLCRGTT